MRSDQQQAINRLAGTSATAFLCAVLCVYPLYIDKFSNLGVTKFTGCFTLFLLFLLWLVACTAIGARAPRPRNANAGRDVTLWGVLAFAGTSLISTFTSLSPTASTWGLGGYYGGLMLVLFTAAGYWAVRSYLDLETWILFSGCWALPQALWQFCMCSTSLTLTLSARMQTPPWWSAHSFSQPWGRRTLTAAFSR